jgi:Cys-tRNA(Pro)/Cys-tRNA(Cys) deacylase
MNKTNVMRLLESQGIPYQPFDYTKSHAVSADEVAKALNEDPLKVFKTLVTVGKSREHYVFVVPSTSELDLKKAAKASDEKNIEMITQKELLPLTGYIHGGCSPIGMKKKFLTFVDESALKFPKIYISGGRVGLQVQVNPQDLEKITGCQFTDLCL